MDPQSVLRAERVQIFALNTEKCGSGRSGFVLSVFRSGLFRYFYDF